MFSSLRFLMMRENVSGFIDSLAAIIFLAISSSISFLPADVMLLYSGGDVISWSIFFARSTESLGVNNNPVIFSLMISGMPPVLLAITGSPED
jgi:hypothetical protein